MRFIYYFMLSFFLFPSYSNIYAQKPDGDRWKLARDKNGVKIYTYMREGSKIKEFKVFTTFITSLEKMVEVLLDVNNYKYWSENLKYSELLKKISDNEIILYSQLKIPWPFDNRDVVNHTVVTWSPSKDTVSMSIKSMPDYIPEKKGVVRMPMVDGGWRICRMSPDSVNVVYFFDADPGGNMPAWLVNIFIVEGPYKTISNLRKYLHQYAKKEEL